MLGKNIIELQEELSYMPMQKLIDMVDSPDSIYGSLTLVEIKNRESLQNSATDMSPTPTVAEDVISSVASPASLDSSPNLSPNSGGIANLEQPQPPMQMMAEGRTVRLSDEMGEDFSLPPGGLMDLLPEGEEPYLGDEEAIIEELNQLEAEEDLEDLISYQRSNQQTIPQAPISGLGFDLDVAVGDDQFDSGSISGDNFNVNFNREGNVRGSYDINPNVTAFIDAQSEDENDMKAGIRGSIPFSTGGLGYAEGGEVETEEEDIKLFGKDGALFDPTNPMDYALAIPGLGALGLGAKGISMAYKAYKAGKISKKALVNTWKRVKNPKLDARFKGGRDAKPGFTRSALGVPASLVSKYPKISAGAGVLGAYNILDPLGGDDESLNNDNQRRSAPISRQDRIRSQLSDAEELFGYPTRDERESNNKRMMLMGLGSNIAGATSINDIVQGNYDLMSDQETRERQAMTDDIAMVQGIQSLDPKSQRISELASAIKAMQNDPLMAQSPEFTALIQEYIALIQPQGIANLNAPTGGEVLANPKLAGTFAQIDNS
tara:strand:+ start:3834 stop:5474 length:1641 start_codon:yes stop_codon:yes gene_type:complete